MNVGLGRIAAQGGDAQQVMVLKSLRTNGPAELRAARADARRLHQRAYHDSTAYGATGRAHLPE